jgi:ketosteroid isomerase-like protein
VTRDEAWAVAKEWIAAWNAHDLDRIVAHYEETVELTSPVAARLLGTPNGRVVGKAALRAYFERGLEAYAELRFELKEVFVGLNSVVLVYANQNGTHTAEYMELSAAGRVVRVVANYGS